MKPSHALLLFAAAIAPSASACSSDSNSSDAGVQFPPPVLVGDSGADAQTGQSTSPVGAGEAGVQDSGPRVDAALQGSEAGTIDSATPAVDAGLSDASTDGAATASGDPEFDTCYAQLKPNCFAKEMNTAELMETPCKALTAIPVPLSDGSMYGPITTTGGPYGGKVEWNEGAGTAFVNPVNLSEQICVPVGIDTFAEPKSVNDEIKNLRDVDWSLYTVFRPACFKKGEKYPVITWANGTCGEIAGYAALLTTVASHGFIVIASNSTWTNSSPTEKVQLRALDYAKTLNEDPKSIFYQKLDMDHIGAMGHSQGAAATGNADNDPRVKASIFWNGGNSNDKPFLNVSGERDVQATTPATMASGANAATKPGAWVYYHKVLQTGGGSTGHLTLMEQPERVVDLAVGWWKWQLKDDAEAKKMFVGAGCGLCNKADEFEYGANSLLK
jgi:pimeloyl-ACP methyl ester carboxylesterase